MSDLKKLEELFLRADWDDAPTRARQRRGKHKQLWLSILLVCIAFGAVANYLDSRQLIQQKSEAVRAAVAAPAASIRAATPQPSASYRTTPSQVVDYDEQVNRLLSEPTQPVTNPEPKQTVFTDANYVPANQVNTISMAQPRAAVTVQSAKPKPGYVTVVKESKSDCFPFKDGSIECRRYKKAVKNGRNYSCYRSEHKYTEACRRAELYNPMN